MIKLDNIVKIYNPKKSNEFEALHGISAEINDGEMVAIIGKSGSGKSTLLNLLGGLDAPTEGKIYYNDTDISSMNDTEQIGRAHV